MKAYPPNKGTAFSSCHGPTLGLSLFTLDKIMLLATDVKGLRKVETIRTKYGVELRLYYNGTIWGKRFLTRYGLHLAPLLRKKFLAGKMACHPMSMNGLGTEPED